MDLQKPIVAMIHNTKLNRWHPAFFLAKPLRGPEGQVVRHKSKGHHTDGFDNRESAIAHAQTEIVEYIKSAYHDDPLLCLDKDFPWEGEGVPAMVVFFGERDGVVEPMF